MKKIIGLVSVFVLVTQTAYGFCTWGMVPPGRVYEPVDATEVFIHYDNGVQTMVLQPEFQGNAEEFAIVYPTPSRPTVEAGPTDLFWQLDSATNPWIQPEVMFMEAAGVMMEDAEEKTVTVVEEKQVGDFDVTILTATDADDLVEWLSDHDYAYNDSDTEKMGYYVNQGGFYFIALKVNMEEWVEPWTNWQEDEERGVAEDLAFTSPPVWFGELSPLEISFETGHPQLPMRTLKSNMPTMTFDLYTVGDNPWYVPSVDTVYADIVDQNFLKQVSDLAPYDVRGKWIVRQEVKFNPGNSDTDLYLMEEDGKMDAVSPDDQVRFSPNDLDSETGVLPGTRGRIVVEGGTSYQFTRSMTVGSRGEDVRQLQVMLNQHGFTVSESGPGSVGNESIYFGQKTRSALIRFQNFYRDDILTPVGLSSGTGYFGPSTIKYLESK